VNPKLDGRLHHRLAALEELPPDEREAARDTRVGVFVTFHGDLDEAERNGLQVDLVEGDIAVGLAALRDLEEIASLAEVVRIAAVTRQQPDLHASVPEIHADHTSMSTLGLSGSGVIVGVIDTGIDIFHKSFVRGNGKTQILSILDLTLRQTISMTGGPTGGTFQLKWTDPPARLPASGPAPAAPTQQTTAAIPFTATAAAIQSALEGMSNINPGDIAVAGGPLPGAPVAVDFIGRYEEKKIGLLVPVPTALTGGASPKVVIVRGRRFSADEINAALAAPDTPLPHHDTVGHGTHVAGTAAGDGSQSGNCHLSDYYVGVAPGADIIMVKTTFDTDDTVRGVRYIFDEAAKAPDGTALPIPKAAVVNMSLGGGGGGRDGKAAEELLLDAFLVDGGGTGMPGRAIVVSAGNDGGLYDHANPGSATSVYGGGLHAFAHLLANQTNLPPFEVVVDGNDRNPDFIDIWYGGAARITVNVTAPAPGSQTLPAPIKPNDPSGPFPVAGNNVSVYSSLNSTPNRHHALIVLDAGTNALITPGRWTIQLTETAGTATDVDIWIAADREDRFARFANAFQSRTRTLTVPSTAQRVICVGAYNPADSTLALFSSRGPTTDLDVLSVPAPRTKPDICAPGVGIVAPLSRARGGACCDCCYDFYVPDDGTSMAAPHVAGIVALMFQRNHTLTFEDVRGHLKLSGRPPDPITGPTLPNSDWGAGKVDAKVAAGGVVPVAMAEAGPVAVVRALQPAPDAEALVLPIAAYASMYLPLRQRVRDLEQRVGSSPSGQLAAALVSTHVDEILRLVRSDRRVTVAWHRMHGPVLLRLVFGAYERGGPLLPARIEGVSTAAGLARLIDELARCGSPALRADIAIYRAFALSLVGTPLTALDHLGEVG
jgi:subtilisin family serine protease